MIIIRVYNIHCMHFEYTLYIQNAYKSNNSHTRTECGTPSIDIDHIW